MPLSVAVGYASLTGPRERNEDFCGFVTPEGSDLDNKGVLAAVADGIGGHRGGREAAEYTVRGLLADYYATPDTWSIPRALETVTTALNRWVIAEAARNAELAGMATTLSALILRGRRYTLGHIGDSRIYRFQDGVLQQMTVDHTWEHPELSNVLSRAIGLDPRVLMDFADGDLAVGDRFILVSDGVWGILPDPLITEVLLDHPEPRAAAAALTSLALAQGGHDNASAVVVDVVDLPPGNLRDVLETDGRLPLPHRLKPGHELDGYLVDEILHDSRETLLYRVHDSRTGQALVLKTLQPALEGDTAAHGALLMEEWRARRVVSPAFPQVVPNEHRSSLYYLMTWHAGATLQSRLDAGQHFAVADSVRLGIALVKAIAVLHRLEIVHRDIKPDNVHLGQDGVLRILDLGVAVSPAELKPDEPLGRAGTPSYMAPELFAGSDPAPGFDLYAAGVTLYHLLTRKYPYGEVEPFQTPKFGEPVRPTRWRPEIPGWLENVLLKAVAKEGKDRFETAEEFLLALERGASRPVAAPARQPLAQRNPLLLWKMVAAISLGLNLVLLLLLMR
ncbi:MAG TPA: bifunctional protein-serine/threonine kinase/phosphatase [Rhodocyclaceae bacterium]|jgi:serine/threonine protein phosphatase PrpC|nr:bifunctional protein-serine/threonine kinase/phosphatase [Rhodocyclaceae bacterium]HMW77114.1 bifunctional protein-serine/threonine kinase/phosphatase [Rhodocyclaceae bacterium]HNE44357.1 bifunctional protein-serine/threonine kinase/phosphatase [Rhodocyclaceae bacterium]HNL21426.1 bifunctional protein-serine/threonine kinase/phosphatase [Rhodocyclaceae bacterium]HNM21108.1 bifunctional protein-serine/threonine kinase/phosphatase [Rhodocyclaceae bacterium]